MSIPWDDTCWEDHRWHWDTNDNVCQTASWCQLIATLLRTERRASQRREGCTVWDVTVRTNAKMQTSLNSTLVSVISTHKCMDHHMDLDFKHPCETFGINLPSIVKDRDGCVTRTGWLIQFSGCRKSQWAKHVENMLLDAQSEHDSTTFRRNHKKQRSINVQWSHCYSGNNSRKRITGSSRAVAAER